MIVYIIRFCYIFVYFAAPRNGGACLPADGADGVVHGVLLVQVELRDQKQRTDHSAGNRAPGGWTTVRGEYREQIIVQGTVHLEDEPLLEVSIESRW